MSEEWRESAFPSADQGERQLLMVSDRGIKGGMK